jgi:hypothetical protein
MTAYEANKYTMQTISFVYIGAKFTYEELLENEDINFKFKAIVERYILPESTPDTTLESELYFLQEGSFIYKTYQQLRLTVKVNVLRDKKHLFRKPTKEYTEEIWKLKDLVSMPAEEKQKAGVVIQELILSKTALLGFAL